MNKGLENAPKIMQDFVMSLNKKPQKPIKPSWLNKHRALIVKLTEGPYKLIKWFIVSAIILALIIEQGGYYYVA